MALNALLDLEIAVPDPDALVTFWTGLGLDLTAPGVLGTADRPSQLRLREGRYRHVAETRIACDDEADLAAIATRLDGLGVRYDRPDDRPALVAHDPVGDHRVVIEVATAPPLTPPVARAHNRPGRLDRLDRRSSACLSQAPHRPRRVGHVVFGTPDVAASVAFYVALGFRVSDVVGGGAGAEPTGEATQQARPSSSEAQPRRRSGGTGSVPRKPIAVFLRCSTDHHNLLLAPSPVPCLNHYALELDDVDAIGLTGAKVLAERPDAGVVGIGRHVVGANLFWYLLDPAGGMFELFADMDQITDDERWEAETRRDDWDPFAIAAWAPGPPTADFLLPSDLDTIAAGRADAGLAVA